MNPTPETHVFIGMFRPPYGGAHHPCPVCKSYCVTLPGHYRCWQEGHFDTPQYATREEIIDRIAEKAAILKLKGAE